jgi:hypothetical protein
MLLVPGLAALAAALAASSNKPLPPPPVVAGCANFTTLQGYGLSSSSGKSRITTQPSAAACCQLCKGTKGCVAFSYHPAGTHSSLQCATITALGHPHPSAGTISGHRFPLPAGPPPPPPHPPHVKPPLPPALPPSATPQPPLGFQPNIVFVLTGTQVQAARSLAALPAS